MPSARNSSFSFPVTAYHMLYFQVYFGPNGDKMLEYFKHTGVAPPASVLSTDNISNNADYLTDLVVGADREGRASEFAAAYDKSDLKREMDGVIARNAKV